MSDLDLKRKNSEFSGDFSLESKRLKLEDIIFEDISTNKVATDNSSEDFQKKRKTFAKRRKLLESLRTNKKYQQSCKKHEKTYSIKCVREKVLESSKEKRFNLVQSFRSLNVTEDQKIDSMEENVNSYTQFPQDDGNMSTKEVNELEDKDTKITTTATKSEKKFTFYDEENLNINDCIKNWQQKLGIDNDFIGEDYYHSTFNKSSMKIRGSDDDFDSSKYRKRCKKKHQKRLKVVESFTITRERGTDGYIFRDLVGDDDSDFFDDSDCECNFFDNLHKKLYYSSDEESMSDYDIESYYE